MFLNSILLAGLGAAVMPIVLHFLNRTRGTSIEWGAMLFLEDPAEQSRSNIRWRYATVLGLRVLTIVLVALAVARPRIPWMAGAAHDMPTAWVIVIDGSASMTHPEWVSNRFELARKIASTDLANLRRGDQAALIEIGSNIEISLTADLQAVASRLASLKPSTGAANLSEGVHRAGALLRSSESTSRVIHLISDRQESAWADLASMPDEWRNNARVIATPVGSTENQNIAIESIDLVGPPPLVFCPVNLRLRVRNYSDAPVQNLMLRILQGEKVMDRTWLTIDARASKTIDRPITFASAGSQVVTAQIDPSGVTSDDQALLAIDVREPIRVVIVEPDSNPSKGNREPSRGPNYPLIALASAHADARPFEVRMIGDPQLLELTNTDAEVIIFCDSAPDDPLQLQQLQSFVHNGAGVIFAPGARVNSIEWEVMREGMAGVPPRIVATLERKSNVSLTNARRFTVASGIDVFAGVEVRRWNRLEPTAGDIVLGRLKNNDPIGLETPFGNGRIVTVAVPFDEAWSNFPLTAGYLPWLQEMVRYLVPDNTARRNLTIGASLDATIDRPKERFVTIDRPDGRQDRVELLRNGNQGILRYTSADVPGRYVLRAKGEQNFDFIVRARNTDSDIAPLNDSALQRIVDARGIKMTAASEALLSRDRSVRLPPDLAAPLLALAMACLLAEGLLVRRGSAPKVMAA